MLINATFSQLTFDTASGTSLSQKLFMYLPSCTWEDNVNRADIEFVFFLIKSSPIPIKTFLLDSIDIFLIFKALDEILDFKHPS